MKSGENEFGGVLRDWLELKNPVVKKLGELKKRLALLYKGKKRQEVWEKQHHQKLRNKPGQLKTGREEIVRKIKSIKPSLKHSGPIPLELRSETELTKEVFERDFPIFVDVLKRLGKVDKVSFVHSVGVGFLVKEFLESGFSSVLVQLGIVKQEEEEAKLIDFFVLLCIMHDVAKVRIPELIVSPRRVFLAIKDNWHIKLQELIVKYDVTINIDPDTIRSHSLSKLIRLEAQKETEVQIYQQVLRRKIDGVPGLIADKISILAHTFAEKLFAFRQTLEPTVLSLTQILIEALNEISASQAQKEEVINLVIGKDFIERQELGHINGLSESEKQKFIDRYSEKLFEATLALDSTSELRIKLLLQTFSELGLENFVREQILSFVLTDSDCFNDLIELDKIWITRDWKLIGNHSLAGFKRLVLALASVNEKVSIFTFQMTLAVLLRHHNPMGVSGYPGTDVLKTIQQTYLKGADDRDTSEGSVGADFCGDENLIQLVAFMVHILDRVEAMSFDFRHYTPDRVPLEMVEKILKLNVFVVNESKQDSLRKLIEALQNFVSPDNLGFLEVLRAKHDVFFAGANANLPEELSLAEGLQDPFVLALFSKQTRSLLEELLRDD